jgi:hypothetical protein
MPAHCRKSSDVSQDDSRPELGTEKTSSEGGKITFAIEM